MVYGERLDTFDDSKTDLLEFQNAAIQLIGSLASIGIRPPLYKVFPTPTYRRFAQALTDVHKYGTFFHSCVICLLRGTKSCLYMY